MFDIEEESASTARLHTQKSILGQGFLSVAEAWAYQEPRRDSAILSQYTYGEPLQLLQQRGLWLQVQSRLDHYIGWIEAEQMRFGEALPSHRSTTASVILARPDLKAPVLRVVPQDSYFVVEKSENGHALIGEGWIDERNLEALHSEQAAPEALLAAAETQLQRTYIWGGRGLAGLDCSALVQYLYRRIGLNIPRDSDLQRHYFLKHHQQVKEEALQLGDLIFIPGHVMMALNAEEIIHASGHHLRVVRESWAEAKARYLQQNPDLEITYCCYCEQKRFR